MPDDAVGKMVRCPACQEAFPIAQKTEAPAPAPPAAVTTKTPLPAKTPAWDQDTPGARRRKEQEEDEKRKKKKDDDAEEDERKCNREDDDDRIDVPAEPHRADTIMVLGIASLIMICFQPIGFILALVTLIMANTDLAKMSRHDMDSSGRSQTASGKNLAVFSLLVPIIGFVVGIIILIVATGGGRRRRRR